MMNARKTPLRVLVGGHDQKFWLPLQHHLVKTGLFEFREDAWSGHNEHDRDKSLEMLAWADVIVAEWTLGNAVFYAQHKRPAQRLITRFHLQERTTAYPAEVDYNKVDAVVFVGKCIMDECVARFGIPVDKALVVGNFVDVKRYDRPKLLGSEFNLGIIGIVPARKRLDLAVDTLAQLLQRDDRYTLHVKGPSPASYSWLMGRVAERHYYTRLFSEINSSNLRHRVIFDPPGDDVHEWLQQIGFILSPSDYESFHMAIAEGMSSATIPIVWNWEGSQNIYPTIPVISDPVQAARLIERMRASRAGRRLATQSQDFIRDTYDADVVREKWKNILIGPESNTETFSHSHRTPKKGVLVVWAIDNWRTFHRREMLEALAKKLCAHVDMLVVEPGNHYETIARLGWSDLAELTKIASGELIRESDNIYRTRLLVSGIPKSMTETRFQGNAADPIEALDMLIEHHFSGIGNVLHWVFKPEQAKRLAGERRFVYEVYDDYTMDFGSGQVIANVQEAEQKILPLAEHVFFTSKPLHDRKAAAATNCSLVGNGVNYEIFAASRVANTGDAGRPVAGYLGNLSNFFDWELMHAVCVAMPHIDFVFHGQVETERLGAREAFYAAMRMLPNVCFTGRVTRPFGAAAVNRYDVLLIPFVVNEAMHAVNPLKLWEYFATGRPVVSTPMDAIDESEPLVVIADGQQQWVDAIDRCLHGDAAAAEVAEMRRERAKKYSWDALTRMHADVLRGLFRIEEGGPPVIVGKKAVDHATLDTKR